MNNCTSLETLILQKTAIESLRRIMVLHSKCYTLLLYYILNYKNKVLRFIDMNIQEVYPCVIKWQTVMQIVRLFYIPYTFCGWTHKNVSKIIVI